MNALSTPAPITSKPKMQGPYTSAPDDMYWVYTEKGASIFQTNPGAVLVDTPYRVPTQFVNEGLVELESLE